MKFTTLNGEVTFESGELGGDANLVQFVHEYVLTGVPAGCNYWSEIAPSLASEWEAYLTICGALAYLFGGQEPVVDGVPENPDGYEEEGPRG